VLLSQHIFYQHQHSPRAHAHSLECLNDLVFQIALVPRGFGRLGGGGTWQERFGGQGDHVMVVRRPREFLQSLSIISKLWTKYRSLHRRHALQGRVGFMALAGVFGREGGEMGEDYRKTFAAVFEGPCAQIDCDKSNRLMTALCAAALICGLRSRLHGPLKVAHLPM
jgi:hypothetical protein